MSETIELRDYEQAQTNLALKEAQRGLVVHALIALLSVVVYALLVLRAHDLSSDGRHGSNGRRSRSDALPDRG